MIGQDVAVAVPRYVGDRAAAVAEAFNRGLLTPEPRDNPDRR